MKKGKILLSGLDPRFPYSNILISKLFLAYGSHGLVSWELGRARKARDPYRTWPWPIGAGCEICTAIQAQQLSKQSIWVKWLGEILWLRLMTARLYADGPTCHVLFPYYSHCLTLGLGYPWEVAVSDRVLWSPCTCLQPSLVSGAAGYSTRYLSHRCLQLALSNYA